MFNPCEDNLRFEQCKTLKCKNLRYVDMAVSAFFFFEMAVKMLSQCAVGHRKAYLASGWNRLDFAIVLASFADYVSFENAEDAKASDWAFIRVIRILRPLRAIKRIPSLRLLVTLLCDTLPALGSIIVIVVFTYFIFGIIGVQLWSGVLRQRCFLRRPTASTINISGESFSFNNSGNTFFGNPGIRNKNSNISLPAFYESPSLSDFTCGGFLQCTDVVNFEKRNSMCETLYQNDENSLNVCNEMIPNYNNCKTSDANPLDGGISFDNIVIAFITIFQAVSPEGWTTVMYTVQDAYSFYAWPYFVFLIIVITFGVSNLSFIVVAIQIPQTKRRLADKMKQEQEQKEDTQMAIKTMLSAVNRQLPFMMPGLDSGQILARRESLLQQPITKRLAKRSKKVSAEIEEKQKGNFYTLVVDLIVDYIRKYIHSIKARCLRCKKNGKEDDGDSNSTSSRSYEGSKKEPCFRRLSNNIERNRDFLKSILQHSGFLIFMSIAIFINTISMAVEHHEQPKWLTRVVDSLNVAFTVLFTVELIITVYAYGFVDYIRNIFNALDLAVVVISLVELVQEGRGDQHSGLSVLRTFRLLRIFKLLRFSPAIQHQLVAIFHTINNVAPFILLFSLFIFIFVVLGVLLFGCNFCTDLNKTLYYDHHINLTNLTAETDNVFVNGTNSAGQACEIYNRDRQGHFSSLLSALLTVLKVLTQDDDWAEVLRDTMFFSSSYWPAAYFVSLLMLGKYVILSMLLAIIDVESSPTAAAKRLINTPGGMVPFGSLLSVATERSYRSLMAEHHRNVRRRRGSYSRAIGRHPLDLSRPSSEQSETDRRSLSSYRLAIERNPFLTPVFSRHHYTNNRLSYSHSPPKSNIGRKKAMQYHMTRRNNSYKFAIASENNKDGDCLDSDFVLVIDEGAGCPQLLSSPTVSTRTTEDGTMPRKNNMFLLSPTLSHTSTTSGTVFSSIDRRTLLSIDNTTTSSISYFSSRTSHDENTSIGNNVTKTNNKNNSPSALQLRIKGLITAKIAFSSLLKRKAAKSKRLQETKLKKRVSIPVVTIEDTEAEKTSLPGGNEERTSSNASERGTRCCRMDYSLFLFHYNNPLRKFLKWLVRWPRFDQAMLAVVIANCVTVAIERPSINELSLERKCLDAANYFFSGIFFSEAVIKIIASGFILGHGAYLHQAWNILDFVLVLLSLVDLAVDFSDGSNDEGLRTLRALRLLRTFKPLRAINRAPGLKIVIRMLGITIKSIANILLICGVFFVAFAVLGLQLFRGCYYHCSIATRGTINDKMIINQQSNIANNIATKMVINNQSAAALSANNSANLVLTAKKSTYSMSDLTKYLEGVQTRGECLAVEGLQWQNQEYNFDNFIESLKALMAIATLDGWIEMTQNGLDCVDIDRQPIHNHAPWRMVYFMAFLILIVFCVVEMFVGLIVNNYKHMKGYLVREAEATSNLVTRAGSVMKTFSSRLAIGETPSRQSHKRRAFWVYYPKWRRQLFQMCNHFYLDVFISILIVANILIMATEYYMMPRQLLFVIKLLDNSFTAIFTLEAVLKVIAFGPSRYFQNKWNRLDFAVVLLAVVNSLLEEIGAAREVPLIEPGIIRVVRIVRVIRALKLLKVAKGVQALLITVQHALPHIGHMCILFLLVFFIYSSFGVELLGRLQCSHNNCDGISRHANFHDFGMAMLTLFRVATGDNWKALLEDSFDLASAPNARCFSSSSAGSDGNDCALVIALVPLYFTSFFVITQFFLVNVVTACLMHNLEEFEKQDFVKREADHFANSFTTESRHELSSTLAERDDRFAAISCQEKLQENDAKQEQTQQDSVKHVIDDEDVMGSQGNHC